jgi:hypothetical protein
MPRAAELRDGQQQTLCASVSTKNPGAFWPGFVWIRKLINQAGSTEVSASCANQRLFHLVFESHEPTLHNLHLMGLSASGSDSDLCGYGCHVRFTP